MDKFFYPKNIAIIGVSDTKGNLGKYLIQNLMDFGFTGEFYAVGVESKEVLGRPVYRSVVDVPGDIDMAVIFVPAKYVPGVAEECGQRGIRRLVVPSAGFTEFRNDKSILEDRILDACRRYNMRLIGPNCMGVVNMDNHLFLPFGEHVPNNWSKGSVGIIAQSGNVSMSYSQHLSFEQIGVSKVASVGNKLNVDEVDLLDYYLEDPETKIVFLYLEGFTRAKVFFEHARNAKKPVIVQKSNRSDMSHVIARSHTGALAANDDIVAGALRQAGVIRVENLEELIHCVKVLSMPPLRGKRLACLASTGGKAVMCADLCRRFGLELPTLSQEFMDWRRTLGRGEYINPTNPLDLGDIYDLETQIRIIQKLQSMEEVDAIFYVIPYSSAWSVNLNYAKVFDFCSDVNKHAKVPVLVYIDFDAPMERFHFYETYSARFFNSLPATLKAIKQVGEVRHVAGVRY